MGTILLQGAGKGTIAASGAPFSLDGTPASANSGSSNSLALPGFTTTFGSDIVYVGALSNGGPITSVTSANLTFTQRVTANDGAPADIADLWQANATNPLSNEVITVHTTTADFITAVAFAFSGSHFAAPFDTNVLIPVAVNTTGNPTWTTTNANDILVFCGRTGSGSGTVDSPFTEIYALNFLRVGYRIVTATQAASTVQIDSNARVCAGSVGDAIIQGP